MRNVTMQNVTTRVLKCVQGKLITLAHELSVKTPKWRAGQFIEFETQNVINFELQKYK